MKMLSREQVIWAYRCFLGREPETEEMIENHRHYADWETLRNVFLSCSEFKSKLPANSSRGRNAHSPPMQIGRVDNFANMRYSHSGGANKCRVLLFGAYGNGNLGDELQAASIAEHLGLLSPDIDVFATTVFNNTFAFDPEHVLDAGVLYCADRLRSFDALLIGGGGLLAHPHVPLYETSWIETIPIPFALISMGAWGWVAELARPLVEKASFVGARDDMALMTLSRFSDDVIVMPDPILVDRPRSLPKAEPRGDVTCWILRSPITDMHHRIAEDVRATDIVLGLEPALDSTLRSLFPQMEFISSRAEFLSIVSGAKRVVSMRLHGCILALRAGITTYGLGSAKIQALYRMLDIPEYYIPVIENYKFSHREVSRDVLEEKMMYWGMRFDAALGKALEAVFHPV